VYVAFSPSPFDASMLLIRDERIEGMELHKGLSVLIIECCRISFGIQQPPGDSARTK
jgi:hypothetical protein